MDKLEKYAYFLKRHINTHFLADGSFRWGYSDDNT